MRTNWDVAIARTQSLGGARVTVRVEVINLFDDPAFAGPRLGYGAPNLGAITGVNGFPRTLQLQARVAW